MSLAVFTAWIFVGCYREMRLELKMQNGSLVWLGFLVFIGLYVAGFDAWLSQDPQMARWNAVALRLGLAGTTFGALTYLMVLLEPKDRVQFRWLGSHLRHGQLADVFSGLQAFLMAYRAAVAVTVALVLWLGTSGANAAHDQALVGAALGFLTRDVGFFVLMQTWSRLGRVAGTLVLLLALYLLIPSILRGIGQDQALFVFYPQQTSPVWLGPAAAWIEALVICGLAVSRLSLGEREPLAQAA